jgi:hypothetical protein
MFIQAYTSEYTQSQYRPCYHTQLFSSVAVATADLCRQSACVDSCLLQSAPKPCTLTLRLYTYGIILAVSCKRR